MSTCPSPALSNRLLGRAGCLVRMMKTKMRRTETRVPRATRGEGAAQTARTRTGASGESSLQVLCRYARSREEGLPDAVCKLLLGSWPWLGCRCHADRGLPAFPLAHRACTWTLCTGPPMDIEAPLLPLPPHDSLHLLRTTNIIGVQPKVGGWRCSRCCSAAAAASASAVAGPALCMGHCMAVPLHGLLRSSRLVHSPKGTRVWRHVGCMFTCCAGL